jgi:uncharacterized protein (DUF433 family)
MLIIAAYPQLFCHAIQTCMTCAADTLAHAELVLANS